MLESLNQPQVEVSFTQKEMRTADGKADFVATITLLIKRGYELRIGADGNNVVIQGNIASQTEGYEWIDLNEPDDDELETEAE